MLLFDDMTFGVPKAWRRRTPVRSFPPRREFDRLLAGVDDRSSWSCRKEESSHQYA